MPAATATSPVRPRAAYENWRPPVIGVALLVPVGPGLSRRRRPAGTLMLPVGGVYNGKALEEAAHRLLSRLADGLQFLRRVAVGWVQTRRRKVITHVQAAAPTTVATVEELAYRDPRATVRVLPTLQLLDQVWPTARIRILVGLQALAIGEAACIEAGVVQGALPLDLVA
ncbi:hypothetical protein ACFV2N_18150 [Streptomyces sp. NPDC059680]|uniref:hypothetical protein n=1 Tax=Streptomyces sp. NPDC059680 TaxID=3346904 RepID=UPI00367AEB75